MMKKRDGSRPSTWDAETGAQITSNAHSGELMESAYNLHYMIRFHTRLYITNMVLYERRDPCQRR
jgi:hypothetical protein